MFYADSVGLTALCERLSAAAARISAEDAGLEPTPLLKNLAQEGKRFRELKA